MMDAPADDTSQSNSKEGREVHVATAGDGQGELQTIVSLITFEEDGGEHDLENQYSLDAASSSVSSNDPPGEHDDDQPSPSRRIDDDATQPLDPVDTEDSHESFADTSQLEEGLNTQPQQVFCPDDTKDSEVRSNAAEDPPDTLQYNDEDDYFEEYDEESRDEPSSSFTGVEGQNLYSTPSPSSASSNSSSSMHATPIPATPETINYTPPTSPESNGSPNSSTQPNYSSQSSVSSAPYMSVEKGGIVRTPSVSQKHAFRKLQRGQGSSSALTKTTEYTSEYTAFDKGKLPSKKDVAATPHQQMQKSVRNTPSWILAACALLLVASIVIAMFSYTRISGLRDENDDYQTSVSLLSANSTTWKGRAVTAEARVVELTAENGELQTSFEDEKAKVADLEAQVASLTEAKTSLESQVAGLETNVAVLEGTVTGLEEQNTVWEQLNTQLQTNLDELQDLNQHLNKTGIELQERIGGMEMSVANLTTHLSDQTLLSGDLNETRLLLLAEIENFQNAVQDLNSRNGDLRNLTSTLQDERDMLHNYTIPSLNTRIQQLEAELGVTEDQLSSTQSDLQVCEDTLVANVTYLEGIIADLELQVSVLESNHSDCQDDNAGLTSDLSTCNEDLEQCEQELSYMTDKYNTCDRSRKNFQDVIVPGLLNQVNRLGEKVDELEVQNDILEENVAEFEELTTALNESVQEYEVLTDELNATSIHLKAQVENLTDAVADLEDVTANLTAEVDRFEILTDTLNETKNDLANQVSNLSSVVDSLTAQNEVLGDHIADLDGQILTLQDTKAGLEGQVSELESQKQNLTSSVDRLEVLVAELDTINTFVNNSATDLGETYNKILGDLSDTITQNRQVALDTTRNLYEGATDHWDCVVLDFFQGATFLSDIHSPVGKDYIGMIMNEVEESVLFPLCLDRADFQHYLSVTNGYVALRDLSWDQIGAGTTRYARDARAYYFPLPGQPGLTTVDWEAAQYTCSLLAEPYRYRTL